MEKPMEMELAKIMGPLLVGEDGVGTSAMTSQASLFYARDLTGKEVVLKRTTARSKEQLDSAHNEVSLLRKIRHPNIVGFCGVWVRPLQPFGYEVNLLLELCPGGHLLDLQRRRESSGRPLTEQEIVRLFVQACRGVECLHRFDPPVAHRDVKLENLLLGGEEGRVVKLCDFGSATTRRTLVTTKEERAKLEEEVLRLTTPSYRAPELVDFYSRKLVSEQVDVWALGCVLYALAFGKHAFGEEGSNLAILSGKYTIPQEPYYSEEFKLLIHWLLEEDPNIRPRVGDVVDELDMLLGNRIKVSAEKRGSGTGNRSSSKLARLPASGKSDQSSSKSLSSSKRPPQVPVPPPSVRGGAAFIAATGQSDATSMGIRAGAMESRRQPNKAAVPLLSIGSSPLVPAKATPPPTNVFSLGPPSNMSPISGDVKAAPPPKPSNTTTKPKSNNPFDDLLPSENPTFFSTPGLRSSSVAGFPDDFAQSFAAAFQASQQNPQSNIPPPGTMPHASSSITFGTFTPSQAPLFYSDPPPQWRANHGV